jgi:amino acid permease
MAKQNDGEKKYLFDNPKNVQRILYGLYACCIVLVLLEFVIHRHVYHSWEDLFAFYPIYGFIGCVLLVLVAKWMRTFLMRDEDYYDKLEKKQHPEPAQKQSPQEQSPQESNDSDKTQGGDHVDG